MNATSHEELHRFRQMLAERYALAAEWRASEKGKEFLNKKSPPKIFSEAWKTARLTPERLAELEGKLQR